jgi:hypothetical protein
MGFYKILVMINIAFGYGRAGADSFIIGGKNEFYFTLPVRICSASVGSSIIDNLS